MRPRLQDIRNQIVRSRLPYGTLPPIEDLPDQISPGGQFDPRNRMPAMPAPRPSDAMFCPVQDVSMLDLAQYLQAANLLIEVPGIPPVAPGTDSPGERVEFRTEPVLIIGCMGTVVDLTQGSLAASRLELSTMAVRLQLNSDDNITTNGQIADFVTMANMFNSEAQMLPLMIQVPATTILHCQFRNSHPVATLQPKLTFYCRTLSGRG